MTHSGNGGVSRREVLTSLLVVGAGGLLAGCRNRTERAQDSESRSNDSSDRHIEAFVRERMAEYGIPGMSVSVVCEARVRSFAFGQNDVGFGIPASPETVYQIASVSKIFAGIAIMLLVDEGLLTVDAPVTDVLPGLPDGWHGIRVHHLLEHTSGLPRGPEAAPGYESEARRRRRREIYADDQKLDHFTAEERLDFLKQLPLQSEPGSTWSYNQMGYMLAGMIVHRLSAVSYPSFLEDRIFGPLEMTSARFGDSRVLVPNRRDVAYTRQYGPFQNWLWPYSTSDYPAAGLNISAPDLAKCLQALAEGRLLSEGARERMWTRARLLGGEAVDYGLGWSVWELEGRTVVGHEGGGCCWLTHVPRDEVTAIALSNLAGSGADDTSDRIALMLTLATDRLTERAPLPPGSRRSSGDVAGGGR